MQVTMTVNGESVTREIEGRLLLVHFLRDELGLTGTHWGCDTSNCGVCVAWLDGEPVKTCTVLAEMAGGHVLAVHGHRDLHDQLASWDRGPPSIRLTAVRSARRVSSSARWRL